MCIRDRYDLRLVYDIDQLVESPREAFYLNGKYYCENNNRLSKSILDNIKYSIGMYSEGKSGNEIADYLTLVLTKADFSKVNLDSKSDYYLISSLICLVHLLEVNTETGFKNLESIVKDDRLLFMFYHKLGTPDIDRKVIHQDPYLFLSMELSREEEYITKYCKNFFHAMKTTSWYDSHRFNFPEFFGYWSFELAYMARFMKVKDELFLDHMFYPRDLALKKWLPTWKDSKEGEEARRYKELLMTAGPVETHQLTKEMIEFIEKEMESALDVITSSKLLSLIHI